MRRLFPRNQPVIAGLLAAVYLLVVGTAGYGSYLALRTEPVLITNGGSYLPISNRIPASLRKRAEHLQALIHGTNVQAAEQKYHATIVDALPWRTPDPTRFSADVIDHLEAVYLAQKAQLENGLPNVRPVPLIVDLAVTGDAGSWDPRLTSAILHRFKSDHILAVVGLGPSDGISAVQLRRLGDAGIPTVASVSTADNIHQSTSSGGIRHFVRIASPNVDEANALINSTRSTTRAKPGRTFILAGTEPHTSQPVDNYSLTLADAFKKDLGPATVIQPFEPDSPSAETTIQSFVTFSLCPVGSGPADVYFAGRHNDLRTLLDALDHCSNNQVRVLSGDDAALTDPDADAVQALRGKVEVDYAAHTDPREWGVAKLPEPLQFGFLRTAMQGTFGVDPDDQAIMGYDTILTIATALNTAKRPTTPAAFPEWSSLACVAGASGPISFDGLGNPKNKPVPIMRMAAAKGRDETFRHDRLLALAWPQGIRYTEAEAGPYKGTCQPWPQASAQQ